MGDIHFLDHSICEAALAGITTPKLAGTKSMTSRALDSELMARSP